MARPGKGPGDHRKLEHAAFMLPVFGAVLLLPPLLDAFAVRDRLFGIPIEVLYLFAAWILLIVGAGLVSRRMPRPERRQTQNASQDGG